MWIEIHARNALLSNVYVTPLAGVWIEIEIITSERGTNICHSPCGSVDWNLSLPQKTCSADSSLPLRECGLKYFLSFLSPLYLGHSPCGSVDWNTTLGADFVLKILSLPLRECGLKLFLQKRKRQDGSVTPLAGVWIEIIKTTTSTIFYWRHSPCGSVDWNTPRVIASPIPTMSLPLRECGLKSFRDWTCKKGATVTPLAGVWIEIESCSGGGWILQVTPLAGVWIEISLLSGVVLELVSLPLRECGLKLWRHLIWKQKKPVTPLAGVWIEMK